MDCSVAAFEAERDDGHVEYKLKLIGVKPERLEKLVTQMAYRLREGGGECIYEIGVADNGDPVGLLEEELSQSMTTLQCIADKLHCCLYSVSKTLVDKGGKRYIQEVLVREDNDTNYIDLRVAVIGSVDCAKSTMLGVLVSSELDDGRGKARLHVFNHPHEVSSGRTSSQALHIIGFDKDGQIVDSGGEKLRKRSWPEITKLSTKVITLVDLPGHEKYLTTTMSGLLGSKPDYALIMVAGNKGVNHMTREHLLICLALGIPFLIVVSKIDLEPSVVGRAVSEVKRLLKLPGVKKTPFLLHGESDLPVCIQQVKKGTLAPIIKVSFKTGQGLDLLKKLLNCLQPRHQTRADLQPVELSIIESFKVKGVGTVVHGMLNSGELQVGQDILLGPTRSGKYLETKVRSLHCKRTLVDKVTAGKHVCVNIKVPRKHIHRGMVLISKDHCPRCIWEFQAKFIIFKTHHTTIEVGYEPVIHVENIKQAAKIIAIESSTGPVLRGGQKAIVTMRFKVRPVYISKGSIFVFREEKTRGMGEVLELYEQK